jgi:MoaA/NifB/PqqE/SkfB family radical SAM enzyme
MKRNLSAFSNFLRAKYAMYTGALRIDSYPYYMNIDPADVCQLRCPTCTTGIENESRRKRASALQMYRPDRTRMTPDLYNALLDEMGEYLFLVNFYNYGEPLLNQHLPTFIEKANRLDIDTIVHSNLSLKLSDERIDALMSCGLDRLTCSVDGFTQPVYEIHRVGGDVELVKRNLARLAKARDRLRSTTQITYKFLVFSHNEHEVDAAQAFAESIGILFERNDAFVYEESWLPSYRKGEAPHLTAAEMARLAEQWEAAGHRGYFRESELQACWSPIPRDQPSMYPGACAWHYGYSVVTASGAVAPCCAAAKKEDDFGMVRPGETSFRDVWNGDRFVKSRMAFRGAESTDLQHVDTICMRCYYPKFVHHLYTPYDICIIRQARELFGDAEPQLARAFELLGTAPPDIAAFVAHWSLVSAC